MRQKYAFGSVLLIGFVFGFFGHGWEQLSWIVQLLAPVWFVGMAWWAVKLTSRSSQLSHQERARKKRELYTAIDVRDDLSGLNHAHPQVRNRLKRVRAQVTILFLQLWGDTLTHQKEE